MPCSYSYNLQVKYNKRFGGAVSITVVIKDFENKVEGLSPRLRVRAPLKPFLFFIFCFRKEAGNFSLFTCLQKKACFDALCTCKATSLSKMASLAVDTATMQKLLLKTCTSSA